MSTRRIRFRKPHPQAAVNAVYYIKIQELPQGPERDGFVAEQREKYREDVDLYKLADDLVIDAVVAPEQLRTQIARRFDLLKGKRETRLAKKRAVPPM